MYNIAIWPVMVGTRIRVASSWEENYLIRLVGYVLQDRLGMFSGFIG